MGRMVRTQISLTTGQAEALKRIAAERGVSMAAVVRDGVDVLIERSESHERWRRFLAIVGKYRSRDGATDVSVNHDRYLDEIYHDW